MVPLAGGLLAEQLLTPPLAQSLQMWAGTLGYI